MDLMPKGAYDRCDHKSHWSPRSHPNLVDKDELGLAMPPANDQLPTANRKLPTANP